MFTSLQNISEIPGFAWTADFYNVTLIHYIASIVFLCGVVFHIFYHGLRKDYGLLPKKGDISKGIKVLLAMIGIGKEPPSEKYLPEQRIAYVGIGFVIILLLITGIIKILKNLEWILLSPEMESINTIIHTLSGFLFFACLHSSCRYITNFSFKLASFEKHVYWLCR